MLHHLISVLILMSDFIIYDSLLFKQDILKKCKISISVNYYHIFFFNDRYQNRLRKFGGRVVKQLIYNN